jgi:hypothetical protein
MSFTQVLPNRPETQLRPACSPSDGTRTASNPVRKARVPQAIGVEPTGTGPVQPGQGLGASLPATTQLEGGRLIVRVRGPRTRHRRPCTRCLDSTEPIASGAIAATTGPRMGGSPPAARAYWTVAPSRATSSRCGVKPTVSTAVGNSPPAGNASTVGPAPETAAGTPAARKSSTNRAVAG